MTTEYHTDTEAKELFLRRKIHPEVGRSSGGERDSRIISEAEDDGDRLD